MLPTCLGIGAARSGTTTVHRLLGRHPSVYVPPVKELHYFSFRHERDGLEGRRVTRRTYEAAFAGGEAARHRIEFSPSYMWVAGSAGRIHELIPDAKIVCILREPAMRFVSDHRLALSKGRAGADFRVFVKDAIGRFRQGDFGPGPFHPGCMIWKGVYDRQLRPYFDAFGRENCLVCLFDELARDGDSLRRRLFEFLELPDDSAIPPPHENASSASASTDEDSLRALRELYAPSVRRLSTLLGIDLTFWTDPVVRDVDISPQPL